MNKQSIECYDNGGSTLDRYTIVISTETGLHHHVFLMSHDPDTPGGVNEDKGTIEGDGWKRETFGEPVELASLPQPVQDAIEWRRQEAITRDWEHIL